jgi:hypothetical protein
LVDCIVDLEGLTTGQLVISVNEKSNLVRVAVVHNCIMNVWNSSNSLLIDHQLYLFITDAILLQKPIYEKPCAIGGCIIDYNNVKIGVLLVEQGLKIILKSIIFSVIVGRDDDAEGEFSGVLTQMINLLKPILFSLVILLYLHELECTGKCVLQVGLLHQPIIFTG